MSRFSLFVLIAACGPTEPAAETIPEPVAAPAEVHAEPAAAPEAAPAGAIAPISAEALRDQITAPSARPRLYNFWATWCGPCVAELPALTTFAKEHPEIEVVLVNVDMTSIRDSKVAPFLRKRGVTGVTSLQLDSADPAGDLPRVLADWPDTIPVTLFVKPDGTRAKQFNGAVRAEDLQIGLDASLG